MAESIPNADAVLVLAPAAASPAAPLPHRTVADLIAEVILRGKSPKTRAAYRSDIMDFLTWLVGGTVTLPADPAILRTDPAIAHAVNATLAALQRVTEADIASYLTHLATPRDADSPALTPATRNRRLTPLRLLFQRMHRYQLIAVNPIEFIKGARLSNVSATVYLSRAEARLLEDACAGPTLRDLRDRALIVFMLATGVRSSEAIGLDIADLGTLDGHAIAWVTGKGGARERLKIAPRARRVLDQYLQAAGISAGPIFRRLRPAGRDPANPQAPQGYHVHGRLSYVGLKYILRQRFAAAQLPEQLSPHSLRHSFITLALRGGATLPMVQAAARHANPQTTMRYAHGMDDLDNNAVDYVNW